MTSVRSVRCVEKSTTVFVGQQYSAGVGVVNEVVDLKVYPVKMKKEPIVIFKPSDTEGTSDLPLTKFLNETPNLAANFEMPSHGLHHHHLMSGICTIAVGQQWQHYKGKVYMIADVSLDANVGADDFGKARISYYDPMSLNLIYWNLTVEEFLRDAPEDETEGVFKQHRFTKCSIEGPMARFVQPNKSLFYLWGAVE